MRRLINGIYSFLIVLSVMLSVYSFCYARNERDNNAIGGEVFTLLIPTALIEIKLSENEREHLRLRRRISVLTDELEKLKIK